MIAHRLSTILNADKIIVVEHVQVVEIDRHQELLNRQGLYSTLFQERFISSVRYVTRVH
ncbi:MAG TPA: hypothetical protein VHK27_09415 [Gammaproteobacteria bacterium]|nr:hypothetical protein [Gammaproteobacteria bacterium]